MISGIFHSGSGIGNQLHRYVATRVLAEDKGYDFSMIGSENFKGKSFMDLDMGREVSIPYITQMPAGKIVPEPNLIKGLPKIKMWEEKTNYYNPEFNFIEDNTIIDGEFQSLEYFVHRLDCIDNWLKVEPIYFPDDVCVIGFRGGEFYVFPELGLPKSYFEEGIEKMKVINPHMKFEVHTDDEDLAKKFFPEFKVIHDVGINWRSVRFARYSIIANSSFYIIPRILRHFDEVRDFNFERNDGNIVTIAPRYWARRNTKEWSRPDNYYLPFIYI